MKIFNESGDLSHFGTTRRWCKIFSG